MTIPAFPSTLPILPLSRISLAALVANDAGESQRLFDACCDEGFFLLDLTDDALGRQLLQDVDQAFAIGKEFFAQDLSVKQDFELSSGNVGYKPLGLMKFKDGKTDLTEICAVGRDSIFDPSMGKIPDVHNRERPFLQSTINHIHPVAMLILRRLATRLEVPFSSFEAMHSSSSSSGTVLRFLHNPPQKHDDGSAMSDTARQTSLLGHTDSGTLTVLFNKLGGLQILPPGADADDEDVWRWVRPEPGCAIINVGDPLVQWTGGLLRSAFHRVLYSPGAQAAEHRYSFGYFLKPANDAPMQRLQAGNVIPEIEASDRELQLPRYDVWHKDKTKKIMKGHQDGVYRGGIRPGVKVLVQA